MKPFNGEGKVGSHWEERILLGDIMNRVFYPEEQAISELTLSAFEDTGFYKVNYFTCGLMQYGRKKGCHFLNSKCLDNNANSNFKNEFWEVYITKKNILSKVVLLKGKVVFKKIK